MKRRARNLLVNVLAIAMLLSVVPLAGGAVEANFGRGIKFNADTLTIELPATFLDLVAPLFGEESLLFEYDDDSGQILKPIYDYGTLTSVNGKFEFRSDVGKYDDLLDEFGVGGEATIWAWLEDYDFPVSIYLYGRFAAPGEDRECPLGRISGLEKDAIYEYHILPDSGWGKTYQANGGFETIENVEVGNKIEIRQKAGFDGNKLRPASDSRTITIIDDEIFYAGEDQPLSFSYRGLRFSGLDLGMTIMASKPKTATAPAAKLTVYTRLTNDQSRSFTIGDGALSYAALVGTTEQTDLPTRLYVLGYDDNGEQQKLDIQILDYGTTEPVQDVMLFPRYEHTLNLDMVSEYMGNGNKGDKGGFDPAKEYEYCIQYVSGYTAGNDAEYSSYSAFGQPDANAKWRKISRDRNDRFGHIGEWKISRVIPNVRKGPAILYIREKLPLGAPRETPPNEYFDKFIIMPRPILNVAVGYDSNADAYIVNPDEIMLQCAEKPERGEQPDWDDWDYDSFVERQKSLEQEIEELPDDNTYFVRTAPEPEPGAWAVNIPASKIKKLRTVKQKPAPRPRVNNGQLRVAAAMEYRVAGGEWESGGPMVVLSGDQLKGAQIRKKGMLSKATDKMPIYMKTPPSESWFWTE